MKNSKTKIILSAICFALYSFLGSGALLPMGIAYSFYSILRIPFLLLSIFCVIAIFKNKQVLLTIPLCLLSVLHAIVFLMIVYFMITDFAVEGFLYLFASLIQVGIYVVMAIHSLKNSTTSLKNERLWIIPVILQIVSILFSVFALTHGNIRSVNLISEILLCVGLAFLGIYMSENKYTIDMEKDTTAPSLAGYCDLAKHILLLIFTFGIWQYIWIYRTTDFLNTTPNEEKQNPTNKLLLCIVRVGRK